MPDSKIDFVHLHLHTQYSLLDGAIRFKPLFQKAKEYGMDSVAITDHGTMFGALEFFEVAQKENIKPIIGCECYVAPRSIQDKTVEDKKSAHLILLAENMDGYKNLCELASIAQLEGFYYKPRIDKRVLEEHTEGLICLSACLAGEIPRFVLKGQFDRAEEKAQYYRDLFGENNFFLEIQENGLEEQTTVNRALLEMSHKLSIPLVCTNDCHYLNSGDVKAHEILLCIQTGQTIKDPDRFQFDSDQLYFKSPQEMHDAFKDYPNALSNTVDIAKRCEIDLNFKEYYFPEYDDGSGRTATEMFTQQARDGFEKRMTVIRKRTPDVDEQLYKDRLEFELKIINDMGFPGYFLIVADFIQYSKSNGIAVGPGRGSAAGSLVSYAMEITDLDPIEHGLIFERFLNPERLSMPDIDTDFCIRGREQVYKYVTDKYGGPDYVSQIITFGQMKTRAVIRDVGRALDIPLKEVDTIAKMVPDVLGISLDKSIEQEPRFNQLAKEQPEIENLLEVCKTLENLPRHASTHACGVVIGKSPLTNYTPLFKGKNGEVVTQYSKDFVEHVGLVKFDFLGLRNLTVIDDCLKFIESQDIERPDMLNIDFKDPKSFELLSKGDTTGVFQLESSGMKDLLMRLKPNSFSDVTALVALYRPGPLESGMVDMFVERKHGREEVVYPVDLLEPILNETYGVILYQEQVMKIAVDLAGYSMGQADVLRKAMGKKKPELMKEHRGKFISGCLEKSNIAKSISAALFDNIEKFAGYGFNKSHSAAYALIAYQTAWLKAHYPVELMAALLSSENNTPDAVSKFIAECSYHKIPILPPDISESLKAFTVHEAKIRYGLSAVKNVGDAAIDSIIEERDKDGTYSSIFDFCERVDTRKVNKRVIESLILCGALDSTGAKRSQMMACVEDALDHGQRVKKENDDPQMSLFDMGSDNGLNTPILPDIPEWDEAELLKSEKEALGFYVSGHPLKKYENLLSKFANADTVGIVEMSDGQAVRIGGLVKESKTIRTKKGDQMAFVTIEDLQGAVEMVIFPSVFSEVSELIVTDNVLIAEGKLQKKEDSISILADIIVAVDEAETKWTASMHIHMDSDSITRDTLDQLKTTLNNHPGNCSVYLHMMVDGKIKVVVQLPESYRVMAGTDLRRELSGFLGKNAVNTVCKPAKVAPDTRPFAKYKKKYGT